MDLIFMKLNNTVSLCFSLCGWPTLPFATNVWILFTNHFTPLLVPNLLVDHINVIVQRHRKAAAAQYNRGLQHLCFADLSCGLSFNVEQVTCSLLCHPMGRISQRGDCQASVLNYGNQKKSGLEPFASMQCQPFLPAQGASWGKGSNAWIHCTKAIDQVFIVSSGLSSHAKRSCSDTSVSQTEWSMDPSIWPNSAPILKKEANCKMNKLQLLQLPGRVWKRLVPHLPASMHINKVWRGGFGSYQLLALCLIIENAEPCRPVLTVRLRSNTVFQILGESWVGSSRCCPAPGPDI